VTFYQDALKKEAPRGAAKDDKAGAAPPRRAAMRRLKARFKRLKGKLVVQIALEGAPLTWAPKDALVATKGGAVRIATIDAALTTGPGTYAAGVQLTLVLDGVPEADEPVNVTLGSDLALELEAS
jgi:hypothetical protein